MADIPTEHSRDLCKVCCVEGNIYLVGGHHRVTEYNTITRTWRSLPWLQQGRDGHSVCTLDNKIFVLSGSGSATSCEILDLSDNNLQWSYISRMNRRHDGEAVIERKIYVLGGYHETTVEVYDVDQGTLINTVEAKGLFYFV